MIERCNTPIGYSVVNRNYVTKNKLMFIKKKRCVKWSELTTKWTIQLTNVQNKMEMKDKITHILLCHGIKDITA